MTRALPILGAVASLAPRTVDVRRPRASPVPGAVQSGAVRAPGACPAFSVHGDTSRWRGAGPGAGAGAVGLAAGRGRVTNRFV